jgi:folate-binding protein YgfZ
MNANYFLFCPPCISEAISKRLSMYVLRAKVEITCSPDYVDYFLVDENDIHKVPDNLISKPQNKLQSTLSKDKSISLTMLDGSKSYYLIFGDNKEISKLYNVIYSTEITPCNWNEIHIKNMIPNIFNETQDLYIPQSVNLDLIGAINFKKGCYTGQEVVARTHYLGKPKRRMYLGSVALNKNPELGFDIEVEGEKVGSLVNYYKQENNIFKVLVELRIEKIDARPTLDGNEILSLEMQY